MAHGVQRGARLIRCLRDLTRWTGALGSLLRFIVRVKIVLVARGERNLALMLKGGVVVPGGPRLVRVV